MKLLAVFSLFLSISVNAKTMHPTGEWQPPGGIFAIEGSYLYHNIDINDSNLDEQGTGSGGRLQVEYGLTNYISVGAGYQYEHIETERDDTTTTTTFKEKGFDDIEVFTSVVFPLTTSRIYFGASYLFSPETRKFNAAQTRVNNVTGSNVIVPYANFQFPMGPFWIGMRGEWTLFSDRDIKIGGVTTNRVSGGDELDAYATFEFNTPSFGWGVGAGVFLKQKEVTTAIASSTNTVQQSIDKIHALFYMRFRFAKRFDLLIRGDYYETDEQDISTTVIRNEAAEIEGNATLRVMF